MKDRMSFSNYYRSFRDNSSALFVFGKFNPITEEEKALLRTLENTAKKRKIPAFVFTTDVHNSKNPLPLEEKLQSIEDTLEVSKIHKRYFDSPAEVVEHLSKEYNTLIMLIPHKKANRFRHLKEHFESSSKNLDKTLELYSVKIEDAFSKYKYSKTPKTFKEISFLGETFEKKKKKENK